jgi:uncharacterized delta-60 repeat protein
MFFLLTLIGLAHTTSVEAQTWLPDPGFAPDIEFSGSVNAIALQPDGKLLIGGNFFQINGVSRGNIARLNADGTLDTTFDPGSGASSSVTAIALQSDGKVVIAGNFSSVAGVTRQVIARLNADGSLDTTFVPPTGNTNGTPQSLSIQSDGRILVGGSFTSFLGLTRSALVRLNADGSLDTGFNAGLTGSSLQVVRIADLPDGRFQIAGRFAAVGGVPRGSIARLNADGTLDASFNPSSGANGTIAALALQGDGKVLIGGTFSLVNGTSRVGLARLNDDGTLDTTFNPGTGTSDGIQALRLQSDGRVLVGGTFTQINGTARSRIARLNSDGTLDTTFAPVVGNRDSGIGVSAIQIQADGRVLFGGFFTQVDGTARTGLARQNADGTPDAPFAPQVRGVPAVNAIAPQPDGRTVIAGRFSSVGGVSRNSVARLNADGSLDATFSLGNGVNGNVSALAIQSDGRIVIAGFFTRVNGAVRNQVARLNADGSLDTTFDPGVGPSSTVSAVAVQPDGKIIIAGAFTFVSGISRNRVARLNADGTVDTSFVSPVPSFLSNASALVLQPDGKVIVGGSTYLLRANSDGTLDGMFSVNLSGNPVASLALQPDGKVLVGGTAFFINGSVFGGIFRLNSDGTVDSTFQSTTVVNNLVNTISIQPDGKIFIGGSFTAVNQTLRGRVARLNADGSLDTTFDPAAGVSGLSSLTQVLASAILPDGRILIGGDFTAVNGLPRTGLARLASSNCQFTIAPTQQTVPVAGGAQSATVTTDGACQWGAISNVSWIIVNTPSGTGSGTVGYTVLPNTSIERTGTINIAGQTLTVVQESACVFTLTPPTTTVTASGGLRTVTVTTDPTCPWTATSNVPWISVPVFPTPVFGNGSVTLTIAINEGPERVGTLTIAGQTYTVTQEAAPPAFGWLPDPTFIAGVNQTGSVQAFARQSDGKIVIAGTFTEVGGQRRINVARINPDGTVDASFDAGSGTNGNVFAVAVQPDGKILIGGMFTTVNGTARAGLARLNADGSLDMGFNTSTLGGEVYAILVQPDGKIVIGGAVTFAGSGNRVLVARLNADGSRDTIFNPGQIFGSVVTDIVRLDNGKLLISGSFESFNTGNRRNIARLEVNGQLDLTFDAGLFITGTFIRKIGLQPDGKIVFSSGGTTSLSPVYRVNPDGSRDESFDSQSATATIGLFGVTALSVLNDGKILVGGNAATVLSDGQQVFGRLNPDGSLDATLTPGTANNSINRFLSLPDGSVLVGGSFEFLGGVSRAGLTRLTAAGTVDSNFDARVYTPASVFTVVRQADGKFLIGGNFAAVAGVSRSRIARLNVDGTLDTTFDPGRGFGVIQPGVNTGDVSAILPLPDGKILVGGFFISFRGVTQNGIARLNADGTLDTTFDSGTGIIGQVKALARQADGRILIAGDLSTYNGTALGSLIRISADGALDLQYSREFNRPVTALILQPDGKALVAGERSDSPFGTRYLGRYNPDGSLDTTFLANTGSQGPDGPVSSVALQADGKILVGGIFPSVGGVNRPGIARLNADGTTDTSFFTGSGANGDVKSISIQPDGKIVIGGAFLAVNGVSRVRVARLAQDGGVDLGLNPGAGADGDVNAVLSLSNDSAVIGGSFQRVNGAIRNGIAKLGGSDCTYAVTPTEQTFGAAGGTVTVTVTAASGCAWGGASQVPWMTVAGSSVGNGNGTITFNVLPNTGTQRVGILTVAGRTVTITQNDGCNYVLTPSTVTAGPNGGTGTILVTVDSGCFWSATSNAPWITLTSGSSGNGSGSFQFSVAPNTTGSPRTGTITVADRTVTITQNTNCSFVVAPTSLTAPSRGADLTVNVTTSLGCDWTTVNTAPWITFPFGSSSNNSGVITVRVAPNDTAAPRTATITVAGQTVTVVQTVATTVGAYRPGNGFVYLRNANTTGFADNEFFYGTAADIPVTGDWDGNGTETIGIYRNGQFFLRNSNDTGFADIQFAFGAPGDIPIAGDWDGDGVDTIGLVRGNVIFLRNSNSTGAPDLTFVYGTGEDIYIAGDWNGDGIDTIGCFRPSNGFVYLRNSNSTGFADLEFFYGIAGDKPVAGDWNGDGRDTIGVVRGNQWFLRNTNNTGFADIVLTYGTDTDIPITGNWDGQP